MSKLTEEAAEFIRTTQRNAAKTQPQKLLEKRLGRELEDYETVLESSEKAAPILALKAGVDYRLLTCRHCGARQMTVTPLKSTDFEEPSEHPVGSEDG